MNFKYENECKIWIWISNMNMSLKYEYEYRISALNMNINIKYKQGVWNTISNAKLYLENDKFYALCFFFIFFFSSFLSLTSRHLDHRQKVVA